MTDIIIRKAAFSDAAAITDVHVETWKVSYKGLVPDDILSQRTVTAERTSFIEKLISEGSVFVAEKSGNLSGFITSRRYEDTGEIEIFYVLPEDQRQGIGEQLFNFTARELKNAGAKHMTVWTLKDAPSVNFYKKMSGKLSGRLKEWKYGLTVVELVWNLEDII